MKLNITHIQKPAIKVPTPVDNYKNPVGVWEVTTEGDCGGRSTKNLGIWKGHVAEIAFYLADKCYYKLEFKSMKGKRTIGKNIPEKIETTRKSVWISFSIESKTWDMKPEVRASWVADFLDAKDQIDVFDYYGGVRYYAGACLVLK